MSKMTQSVSYLRASNEANKLGSRYNVNMTSFNPTAANTSSNAGVETITNTAGLLDDVNSQSISIVTNVQPNAGFDMKKVRTIQGKRAHSKTSERSTSKTRGLKRSQSSCFAAAQASAIRRSLSKVYDQDTRLVPSYYNRPGPGLYNDFTAGAGEKTQVSKYKNAPKCSI